LPSETRLEHGQHLFPADHAVAVQVVNVEAIADVFLVIAFIEEMKVMMTIFGNDFF